MTPAVRDAISIADKHLAHASPEQRKALALDILDAIGRHAEAIAKTSLEKAVARHMAKLGLNG